MKINSKTIKYSFYIAILTLAGIYIYQSFAGTWKINRSKANDLTSGLVGYWTFDGSDVNWGTNIATDKSPVGANSGTLTGMNSSANQIIGKIGQGLKFDGNDDYVDIGDKEDFDFGLGNYSVSFWYRTTVSQSKALIMKSDYETSGNIGISIYMYTGGNLVYWGGGSAEPSIKTGAIVYDGNWHHVVLIRSGTGAGQTKAYFDNVNTINNQDQNNYNNIAYWDGL